MLSMTVPVLVALVGLLVYALASNGKAVELGRIAFGFGLLVFLAQVATERIALP